MRPSWKLVGMAGLAGVAATGVVVARRRRGQQDYDPAELRERLHRRLEDAGSQTPAADPGAADGGPDPGPP
jgi:hypothetical protein